MKTTDYRRYLHTAAFAASIAIASAAAPTFLRAQDANGTARADTGMMASQPVTRTDTDDDSGKMGWLGLLGLAGLLGLRRRDHVTHTDTTTRRP